MTSEYASNFIQEGQFKRKILKYKLFSEGERLNLRMVVPVEITAFLQGSLAILVLQTGNLFWPVSPRASKKLGNLKALLPTYSPHPTISFLKSILTLGLYNYVGGNENKSNNVWH